MLFFYSHAQDGNKGKGFFSVKVNAFTLKYLKQNLLIAETALCSNY